MAIMRRSRRVRQTPAQKQALDALAKKQAAAKVSPRTGKAGPSMPTFSLRGQAQERLKQARATPTLGGRKAAPNPKASFAEQKKSADAARLRYGQEIAEAAKKQPVQQAKQISMAEMKKLQAQKASAIGAIGTGAIGKAKPKMNAISAIGVGITGKAKRKTKGMA